MIQNLNANKFETLKHRSTNTNTRNRLIKGETKILLLRIDNPLLIIDIFNRMMQVNSLQWQIIKILIRLLRKYISNNKTGEVEILILTILSTNTI